MYRYWAARFCFKAVNVFFKLIGCFGDHLNYARVVNHRGDIAHGRKPTFHPCEVVFVHGLQNFCGVADVPSRAPIGCARSWQLSTQSRHLKGVIHPSCSLATPLHNLGWRGTLIGRASSQRMKTDELIKKMRARVSKARLLATYVNDPRTTKTLLQMAEEGEADIRRLEAERRDEDS